MIKVKSKKRKVKISGSLDLAIIHLRFSRGFTLIELLLVSVLLLTVGVISAINYRQIVDNQKFQNAAFDVAQMLTKAKSRAQSQTLPAFCSSFSGYEVVICNGVCNVSTNTHYALYADCGFSQIPIEDKYLPTGITFQSSSPTTYIFSPITSRATSGNIIISKSGVTKVITVGKQGNISIQ